MYKNQFSKVEEIIIELFQQVENSQNQRIIRSLQESQQNIFQSLKILKEYQEEEEIFNFLIERFNNLLNLAKTDNNLQETPEKTWMVFKNKRFMIQDRLIQSIIQLSYIMEEQCNTFSITSSQQLQQDIIVLKTSQFITIDFYCDNQHTCISYIAPKIVETSLFLLEIELQQLMQRFKNLESILNNVGKNQQILKLCFDQSSQTLKFWSNNDILSYQLIKKQLVQKEDDFMYKIYLDVGMVIKLSPNFSLIIQDINFQDYLQEDNNDEIYPIYLQKGNNGSTFNQRYIKISNVNEDVTVSIPFNSSIKLSTYLQIPEEFEIQLYHIEKGYYFEIENKNNNYLPQLLSQRTQERQLQLKSKNQIFCLGLIILEYTNIFMKMDMETIWNKNGIIEI